MLLQDDGSCVRITSDKWTDASVKYQNSERGKDFDFLELSWKGLDPCKFNTDVNWKFTIELVCIHEDYDVFNYYYASGYDESCALRATIENKIGCAVLDFNMIWEFIEAHQSIFAIVLICVGVFLTFAGYRVFIVTLFLTGLLATMMSITVAMYLFVIPKDAKLYIGWIVLG